MTDQEENYDHDDTNLKYRIRVPNYLYNAFVKQNNFKSRLLLPPRQITQSRIPFQSNDSTIAENYVATLEKSTLYDMQFMREARLTVSATGLQTYEDAHMYGYTAVAGASNPAYFYNGVLGYSANGVPVPANALINNGLGLANPLSPGLISFTDDVMNKMFGSSKLVFGSNGEGVTSNVSRNLLSILNRFLDADDVYKNYQGTKIFDNNSKFSDLTSVLPVPIEKIGVAYTGIVAGATANACRAYMQKGVTLREINNDPLNSLSILNRGQVFATANYVFSKGTPTPNYVLTGGLWGPSPNTTALLTNMTVCGIANPCNFEVDAKKVLASVYNYLFYTNKQNTKACLAIQTLGSIGAGFFDEPAGQTLNVVITLPKISAPLYNPLLHFNSRASFSNTMNLNIDLPYTLNGLVKGPTQGIAGNFDAQINNAAKCVVSISDQSLTLKQYNLVGPMQSGLPLMTTLPFHFISKYTTIIRGGEVATSSVIALSSVPKYVIISCPGYTGQADANTSDESRHNLIKLSTSISGRNDCTSTRTKIDLDNVTRENGLKLWSSQLVDGIPHLCPGYSTTSATVLQSLDASMDGVLKMLRLGTVWILEFGKDIPIENLVGGSLCNESIQYTVMLQNLHTADFQFEIAHVFDSEYYISANSSSISTSLFSQEDVTNALIKFQSKIPHLYVNSHTLRGGNFMLSAVKHFASHILPKVLPKIKKAYEYYRDNKEDIHNTVGNVVKHARTLKDVVRNA